MSETESKTVVPPTEDKESGEKENSSTPVGVKFTYGIPGREVQNKNRLDMPPRPTSNTPKGQRGGVSGRGFGRGRGQNHSHPHSQQPQGRYQGHNPKPRARPPSPKAAEKSTAPGACDFCDRPCTEVICNACGYVGANLRVKKECPKHPRIIRVADLEVCPQCKTNNIEESDGEKKK